MHAETAELALDRLAQLGLQVGTPRAFGARSIDVVVELGRHQGRHH